MHRIQPIRAFLDEFEWIHTLLGLLGNLFFLVGSVLFLFDDLMDAGVVLFIIGAAGMFLGSLGSAILKLVEEKRTEKAPS